jgi:hypothetical protein
MKITFAHRITDTSKTPLAESFIYFIKELAFINGKHEDAKCDNYDQSPVKYEFCQWYKLASTEDLLSKI